MTKKTKWKNSNVYEYWQQQAYFRLNGQIGAPTGKLLISLLNEQNPHCLHSFYTVLPIFYFTVLPTAQFSTAKVWLWKIIIKKWGWVVIYNPTIVEIETRSKRLKSHVLRLSGLPEWTSTHVREKTQKIFYSICEIKINFTIKLRMIFASINIKHV